MSFINLDKITADQRHSYDEDEDGAPTGVQTVPVIVNVAAIRCFYPRKDERPGTRLTFTDGGGFAVSNPPDEVHTRVLASTR